MDTRIPLAIGRAILLAILAVALVGLSYTLSRELKPIPILRMQRTPTTVSTIVPSPLRPAPVAARPAVEPASEPAATLHFPLRGFERALHDNFDERRGGRRHQALDIMAPRGTPVLAVDDGRIAKLYRGALAGISVYQYDASGTRVYFYAHLDRYAPDLAQDQEVRRGDVIGYVGSTGNAPEHAPHLHFALFEVGKDKRWWKGKALNPFPLLRAR